jgi:hypothetical protein
MKTVLLLPEKRMGDINYQPSATQNGIVDNKKYEYSKSTFANVKTTQQKSTKPNDFK